MLLGPRVVSQSAVGHSERVVHGADVRVPRQNLLQQVGGPAVVLLEQRRLRQAVARRQRRRKQRQRLREQRLGVIGPALLQADVAEPEQRRRILGLDVEDLLEERGRLVQGAPVAVQLREVVGPADIVRSQPRRLPQAGLGLLGEPRRHEGHPHHADGLGRQFGGETRPLVPRRQGGMAVANLRLHRFADPAQIRQRIPAMGRRHPRPPTYRPRSPPSPARHRTSTRSGRSILRSAPRATATPPADASPPARTSATAPPPWRPAPPPRTSSAPASGTPRPLLERDPPVDLDVFPGFRTSVRPVHLDGGTGVGLAEADDHARIVRRGVAAVRTGAAPQHRLAGDDALPPARPACRGRRRRRAAARASAAGCRSD